MAVRHQTRACDIDEDPVVEPAPPGTVRRQVTRLTLAAIYCFWAFAFVSFAVGTVNFWFGDVIPWPIGQAGQ